MPARTLDGTAAAAEIRSDLLPQVAAFIAERRRAPSLAIVLVGDDPASHVYVRHKEKAGAEAGLDVRVHRLPATTTLDALLKLVATLNRDPNCDGILVQSPLPSAMGPGAAQHVFDAIDPAKDVDCFNPINVGRLVQGRAILKPCTPSGVILLLERERVTMSGRHAVVIGRSEIVGKPMALLLLQQDATVTICHSRTPDLGAVTRQADIVIAAIGRPAAITADMVKADAAVVDVGTTPIQDRARVAAIFGADSPRLAVLERRGSVVVGDVHPGVADVAGALSPVPGGVGPLTIAMLLRNTLAAAMTRQA